MTPAIVHVLFLFPASSVINLSCTWHTGPLFEPEDCGVCHSIPDRLSRPVIRAKGTAARTPWGRTQGKKPSTARSNPHPDRSEVVSLIYSTIMIPGQQLTSKSSLHSAPKGFFDPLRTNESQADFFAMYRRESGESGHDHMKKYNEDLNTPFIFMRHLISILITKP